MSDKAFTLLEVITALALIAATLVGILVIRGRLIRQSQRSSKVAAANVLAGRLVGEWKNDTIPLEVGEEREEEDATTGFRWVLRCTQQEIEPGVFQKRLEVKVYEDSIEEQPMVGFDVWRPLW